MNAQLMSKVSIILAIVAILPFVFATKSNAEEECFEQYGGGETCVNVDEDSDLEVDKTIWNPSSKAYEDNIKTSDVSYPYTFGAEETISFKIRVKNIGDTRIENINLEDILPSYVTYESGDGDGTDDNTKVEFDEFDLNPGDSKEFTFNAEIASDGVLPKDDRICLTNIAEAEGEVEDSDDEESDVDYANFCIDLPSVKGKEKPTQLPVTGGFAFDATQVLAITMATGFVLVGFGLKKLSD